MLPRELHAPRAYKRTWASSSHQFFPMSHRYWYLLSTGTGSIPCTLTQKLTSVLHKMKEIKVFSCENKRMDG